MNILLAEDDPNISTIAKLALEQIGGHKVTHVDNGEKALKLILEQGSDFDVILLDEMMPGLNGVRVCQEYLKAVSTPQPVIFLSAKSQSSDIKEFLELGKGFIPKPFDPMQLNPLIENILNKTETHAA
ncbi:MAG: response regulator [Bdellovibrionales bacterium]|nr:response regulator [Bdellovibrionales bacterium]